MRSRALFAALLAAFSVAAPARAADEIEEDFKGSIRPIADPDTILLRRIVDAATERPIAGATVRMYCAVPHPDDGPGTPVATGTSGPDGWVRIRRGDVDRRLADLYGEPQCAIAEAPGLGPDADCGSLVEDRASHPHWELDRSTSVRVSLRDTLGRPVEGALVQWLLGSGHLPALRRATTGPDGVATIERVVAEEEDRSPYDELNRWIWFSKPGFAPQYVGGARARWQRPAHAVVRTGTLVEGLVVGHDGSPAGGVAVGIPRYDRGPWARTDASGRFRLHGVDVEAGTNLLVEADEYEVGHAGTEGSFFFRAPARGRVVRLRLPAPGAERKDESANARLGVEIDRSGWPDADAAIWLEAVATREDGWTETEPADARGVALLEVPPGSYVVTARARRFGTGSVVSESATVDAVTVQSGGEARARLALPAPAVLVLGPWPTPVTVEVVTEAGADAVPEPPQGERSRILVPTGRDLALRVTRGSRTRLLAVARLEPGAEAPEARLPGFAPVELRARFVDPQGLPTPGWLLVLEPEESASDLFPWQKAWRKGSESVTPSARTVWGEGVSVVAWPADLRRFQPAFVEVPSGLEDGTSIDLGEVRMRARAPVARFEEADGQPTTTYVRVTNGDRSESVWLGRDGDDDGVLHDPWYAPGLVGPGAVLLVDDSYRGVRGVESFSFVTRLEGPGPWTVRRPSGSLTIEVFNEIGTPLDDWIGMIDDHEFEADHPSMKILDLSAGPHEIVVEAEGRVGRRLRFTLAEGESRTWTARLRPIPEDPADDR